MLVNLLRIAVVTALPVACLFYAVHLAGSGAELIQGKEIGALCEIQRIQRGPDAELECLASDWLWLFRLSAVIGLVVALFPVALFFGAAFACGTNRWANAAIFRRMIPIAILMVCLNLLVQGGLLLFGVVAFYLGYIGNPPLAALGAAGFGIFGAAAAVVAGAATLRVDPVLPTRAMSLDRRQAPMLWETVDAVAEELGSEVPDNILIGTEPNFWVVAGRVQSFGEGISGQFRGRTLFLSLPLMRIMSMEEFVAILGHELGHFRGRDSEYSARFLPVFAAIDGAKYGLDDWDEFSQPGPPLAIFLAYVSRLPARALLSLLGASFAANVSAISRKREYEADAAALEVSEPRSVALSLLKTVVYGRLWHELVEDHADRILLRRPLTRQLGLHFQDLSHLLVTEKHAEALRATALKGRVAHPYDSHPTVQSSIRALGMKPSEISADELRPSWEDGILESLLEQDVVEEIESALLEAEHAHLKATGRIDNTPPVIRPNKVDPLYHAAYSLMAWLVQIAPDPSIRFNDALRQGYEEMTEFDRMIFAEYCRGRRKQLSPEEAVAVIHKRAGPEGARVMYETLEAVLAPVLGLAIEPEADQAAEWLHHCLVPEQAAE